MANQSRRAAAWCLVLTLLAISPALAEPRPPFVAAARAQIGKTLIYDPAYQRIAFPNGDVPEERGVCTDVVIRALRVAYGYDLQRELNADIRKKPSAYPRRWGLRGADTNIDHRRVPNQQAFFRRKGWELPVTQEPKDYRAGDLVTQMLPGTLPHIAIVSDRVSADGRPLVIHNIGAGAREEDTLFAFPITGHYRFVKL
ncbi:DUF1287 domain-containing protein [Methylobacterium brachythecii]|nr:DUF1287 domain-containing protein [Methylobacterium brachythecii]MBB3900835.1 hypothetical protein [Methylobacterium brachythecii]